MRVKTIFKFLCDLFFSLRPVLLIPVWGFSIFGFYCAKRPDLSNFYQMWFTTPLSVYLEFLLFSFSVGVVYILNQLADIEVDKKNGGLPIIASGIISVKSAWIFAIIVGLISVIVPFLIGRNFIAWLSIATISIGVFYSFKPFFFSGRPVFDFLSNATGYGIIAFGAGWCVAGKHFFSSELLIASLPYFLLMASGSINSTLPDAEGDRQSGKNTTAVILGKPLSHMISTVILILAALFASFNKDYLAFACSILSLPIYIIYFFNKTQSIMEATYKIGGALCMLAAFYIMPVFLIISCCLFFITRMYFRICHEVSYPSMVPSRLEK